jgi:thioester reductase-like protein
MNIVPRLFTASIGSMPLTPVARSHTLTRIDERSAVAGASPPAGRKADDRCAGKAHGGSAAAAASEAIAPRKPRKHRSRHLTFDIVPDLAGSSLSLLTGFPGFIGRRLAARLLAGDPKLRLVALVEPPMLEPAREAAGQIDAERIEVVAGDIAERRLGLAGDEFERLRSEVRQVFHLAAIYNLAVPLTTAQRVNVDGTGNVVEFCAAAEKLERHVYISTAYVAGWRSGVVYEHELALGQTFKNHYESTKFQAEVWVRESMNAVPTTILRPAIVVGDSKTGETQKFDGPYFILRVIAEAAKRGQPAINFGRSGASFNVVPVDYVVEAIATAASEPAATGETLHLVDTEPLSARELTEALSLSYAGRAPRGRISPRLVENSLRFAPIRRRFGGAPRESIAYLNHPVTFDTRRAVDLLGPHDLVPPSFRDYVEPMVEFFRAHEDDPAFLPG